MEEQVIVEKTPVDEIKERYEFTSQIRRQAIGILAPDASQLNMTLNDSDQAKLLVKLLDGEDKQTIARQKNATDEKIAGAIGTNLPSMVDQVISQMGGIKALRGEPDSSSAPKEKINLDVSIGHNELQQGEDPSLNYDSLVTDKNNEP